MLLRRPFVLKRLWVLPKGDHSTHSPGTSISVLPTRKISYDSRHCKEAGLPTGRRAGLRFVRQASVSKENIDSPRVFAKNVG